MMETSSQTQSLRPRTGGLPLRWLYLAYLGLAFSTLVISAIAAVVRGDPAPVILRLGLGDFAVFAIALYVLGTLLAVVVLRRLLRKQGLNWDAVGLRGRLTARATAAAIGCAGIAYFLYLAVEHLVKQVGVGMYWEVEKASHVHIRSALDLALVLVFAVLLGPAVEEIIFRGYLLNMCLGGNSAVWKAMLYSALVFTSVHVWFGPGILTFIFLWSFLPLMLFWKAQTLYPAILFHSLNNAIAWLVLPLLER